MNLIESSFKKSSKMIGSKYFMAMKCLDAWSSFYFSKFKDIKKDDIICINLKKREKKNIVKRSAKIVEFIKLHILLNKSMAIHVITF